MTRLLRFADLKDRHIAHSWAQLKRLQKLHNFPTGKLLSPNIRVWTEEEVADWYASRPVSGVPLRGRAAKLKAGKAAKSAASE